MSERKRSFELILNKNELNRYKNYETTRHEKPQETDSSLFEDFLEYTKNSTEQIKNLTTQLNTFNNFRMIIFIAMVLMNTVLIAHVQYCKSRNELQDYKGIKDTFGGYDNTNNFKSYPEFYNDFITLVKS